MSQRLVSLADFEAEFSTQQLLLLQEKAKVLAFIDTDHKPSDTKLYLRSLRASELRLTTTLELLYAQRDLLEFKDAAISLCVRGEQQQAIIRDMDKRLIDDLAERNRAEDKKSVDVLKNVTFLLGVPGSFIAGSKAGLGGTSIGPCQAGGAGLVLSATILARKKLYSGFKAAMTPVCRAPKKIKDSFFLFYIEETVKEEAAQLKRTLRIAQHEVGRRAVKPVLSAVRKGAALFRPRGPK